MPRSWATTTTADALGGPLSGDTHHELLVVHVECRGRLVQQQDAGPLGEHARERRTCPFATRERRILAAGQVPDVGLLHGRGNDSVVVVLAGGARPRRPAHPHDVARP